MREPFPHQVKSCETFAARAREGKRRLLQCLPCGAGKGDIVGMMAARTVSRGGSMLAVVHRRKLVGQLATTLMNFGIDYTVIMADLPEAETAPWARYRPGAPIIVGSQQTLYSRRNTDGIPKVDTLLVDEAHTFDQSQYRPVEQLTGFKYLLGLTGTPCKGDGSGLGREMWDCLDSIITIEELIALGRLCPVKVFGPPKLMENRKKGKRTTKAGEPVEQWKLFADGKQTIVFSPNRKESIGVRDAYEKAGIPAIHVDGRNSPKERDDAFDGIASGKYTVLCTVAIAKEGVDIPILECGQGLTSAISPVVFWQNIGRIQRHHAGKEFGVWLDHSGATAIHGMPNISPTWALAEDDSVQARQRENSEKNPGIKPRMCRQCGAISAGAGKCPECGALLVYVMKADPVCDRENLQEVSGAESWGQKPSPISEWRKILYIASAQKKTCAAASAMFKAKFGQWPEAAGAFPVPQFDDRNQLVRDVFPQFTRGKVTV